MTLDELRMRATECGVALAYLESSHVYIVGRWGLSREFETLAEVEQFLNRMQIRQDARTQEHENGTD